MAKNLESNIYYDEYDAVNFIASQTGINKRVIRNVLNSEMRYMQHVGIIDSNGLDEYLKELDSDPVFDPVFDKLK